MSEVFSRKIQGVVKGGAMVTLGTIAGTGLSFAGKVLITRSSSPSVFGVYSLCFGLTALVYIFSTVGLATGISRYIALYIGKGDSLTARSVMHGMARMALIGAAVAWVVAMALTLTVGQNLYPAVEDFAGLMSIMLLSVPFYAFLDIGVGIGRGYADARPKVLFLDILRGLAFILLLVAVVLWGISIRGIVTAYALAIVIAAMATYRYLAKTYDYRLLAPITHPFSRREVVMFSLPLTVLPIMTMVFNTMDTVMIGYYLTPADVGIYSASVSLSRLLKPVVMGGVFIFLPIATELYAQNKHDDLHHMYQVINKWLYLTLVPCVAMLLMFPGELLAAIFGKAYVEATLLQLLVLGHLSGIAWSMSAVLLIAAGKTRQIMAISISSVVVNCLLNYLLIPRFGVQGAAVATAASMFFYDCLLAVVLYKNLGVQPFSGDYLRGIVASIIAVAVMLPFRNLEGLTFGLAGGLAVVAYVVVLVLVLMVCGGITNLDMILVEMLERKTGKDFTRLKQLLARFVVVRKIN